MYGRAREAYGVIREGKRCVRGCHGNRGTNEKGELERGRWRYAKAMKDGKGDRKRGKERERR